MNQHPVIFAVQMEIEHQEKEMFLIDHWSKIVDHARLSKIKRYRFWQDKWRSLAGDVLVRYLLTELYQIEREQIQFSYNRYGKPTLIGHDIHFNVSHSGKWVVVALHHSPLGVDVEKIGKADDLLAEHLFSDAEYSILQTLDLSWRDEAFFHIWTAKESYLKAIGNGLSIPLDSFTVTANWSTIEQRMQLLEDELQAHLIISDQVRIEKHYSNESIQWYLKTVVLDGQYSLTLCTTGGTHPHQLRIINTSRLIW